MSLPKLLAFLIFCLFATIAVVGWWKQEKAQASLKEQLPAAAQVSSYGTVVAALPSAAGANDVAVAPVEEVQPPPPHDVDRMDELFRTTGTRLPIVETIIYKSHVPWLKGRQAWLTDYAAHYHTSRHFIARSYNGKADYFKQDLPEGARFNVLRTDIQLQFNLVIDIQRCLLWLYYQDLTHGDRILLKTYQVGLGRPDATQASGLLTPLGCYTLGDKVAIFTPTTVGMHGGQKTQLIRIFGTRWIPFENSIGVTSAPAKGYGIHGIPWREDERGVLVEDMASLGRYTSDGCVRLATADMEELFALILTKPTVIELVRHFHEAIFPIVDPAI